MNYDKRQKTLSRLSWLRHDHSFLNTIILSSETRWIVFNHGQPLVATSTAGSRHTVPAFLSKEDVKQFLGPEPFFGQGKNVGHLTTIHESSGSHPAERNSSTAAVPPIVFLGYGVESLDTALPTVRKGPRSTFERYDGTSYFALDLADIASVSEWKINESLSSNSFTKNGQWRLRWSEPRSFMTVLDAFNGGLYATARSLLYWNQTNKFCPACGSPTYSVWAGWKRSCSSLLSSPDQPRQKKLCPSRTGIQNFNYPRTDIVVIVVVMDKEGDRILLGRGKKYPPGNIYSALSGFAEPGETLETAVIREVFEETGLTVWDVRYFTSKPWPYPSSLMVGFYARADAEQLIQLDLAGELESVQWFTRAEVKTVLEHPTGSLFDEGSYLSMVQWTEERNNNDHSGFSLKSRKTTHPGVEISSGDLLFRVPPDNLLPGALIRRWAYGNQTLDSGNKPFMRSHL